MNNFTLPFIIFANAIPIRYAISLVLFFLENILFLCKGTNNHRTTKRCQHHIELVTQQCSLLDLV